MAWIQRPGRAPALAALERREIGAVDAERIGHVLELQIALTPQRPQPRAEGRQGGVDHRYRFRLYAFRLSASSAPALRNRTIECPGATMMSCGFLDTDDEGLHPGARNQCGVFRRKTPALVAIARAPPTPPLRVTHEARLAQSRPPGRLQENGSAPRCASFPGACRADQRRSSYICHAPGAGSSPQCDLSRRTRPASARPWRETGGR